MEVVAILLFVSIFILILYGYPVSFTLGGMSLMYAIFFLDVVDFTALPPRILGVMSNNVLLAVPLFVYMGIMLEKSGIAEQLLSTMALLMGKIKGGLAISVVIVGALLAASTGIVGATVVTMGLISLPVMLKRGYKQELASGVIAASGTLGQIIPPSVVLILLGSVLNVSVGDLFAASLLPGLFLVFFYIFFIILFSARFPHFAPPLRDDELSAFKEGNFFKKIGKAFILPLLLILTVLGSIFLGVASPTEAAAVGALGASLLTIIQRKFSIDVLNAVMRETTMLTSMVFFILLGATTFSFVFRELGGDQYLVSVVESAGFSPLTFLLLVMVVVFLLGFFIDFIEIVFIVVPVVAPIFEQLDMNLLWIGVLIALNLQTSFLTPPFGFALFYLKGVAPPEVSTAQIYKGIIPFVVIQLILIVLIMIFPEWVLLWVD